MKPWIRLLAVALALPAAPAFAESGCKLGVMADLPVTMEGMRAAVPVKINGKDTQFWLDSGAFFSIMPRAKAAELGLKLSAAPQGLRLLGIGGDAAVDLTTVKSFGIVGQTLNNMQFLVGGSDIGNTLIGRNILAMADTEFDLASGSVKLINPHGCDKTAMAYWAPGKPFFAAVLKSQPGGAKDFDLNIRINGAEVSAEFDSGSPSTLISRRAAEKARIDLRAPGVTPISGIGGFGKRAQPGWIVPVASVEIGDEKILNTRLDVIDGPIISGGDGPDVLLGADYMLAHHIYVARGQNRIYFTYGGGKPFRTNGATLAAGGTPPADAGDHPIPGGAQRVAPIVNDTVPKTAADFARRGNARLAAHDGAGAVADFDAAVKLSPDSAGYYRDRARAHDANDQPGLARADLEKALMLDPGDGDLLRIRAMLRLREQDRAGALADTEAAAKVTPPASLDSAETAMLFARLDQPERAIALLGPVIAAHGDDAKLPGLLNERCWLRAQNGLELDAALDDCNRAIRRASGQPKFLDSRGLVYLRQGKYAAAIADYDATLKIDPGLAWSLYGRGLARIALGQTEAGAADKAAAVAIYPKIAEDAAKHKID